MQDFVGSLTPSILSGGELTRDRSYAGSASPKILFLGEAWGQSEDSAGAPFVGWSGKELFEMIERAWPGDAALAQSVRSLFKYDLAWMNGRASWIESKSMGWANVFNFRPIDNNVETLCSPKADLFSTGGLQPLVKGKYLRGEYHHHLDRLEKLLLHLKPNIVVALGNTAMWALTGATNIGSVRGTIRQGELGAWKGKVMPTYHPAGVLRQWSWRPIAIADIAKAFREADFPDIRRPRRQVLVSPTLREIGDWVTAASAFPPAILSADIETASGQITEIGFARDASHAIVIPFVDKKRPGWNYWSSAADEIQAWDYVEELLSLPVGKVFQNGLYDLQYIVPLGLKTSHLDEDTMLKHHSLFPEMQKGLGFLGSIYSSEPAWKLMRRKRPDTEKRDE